MSSASANVMQSRTFERTISLLDECVLAAALGLASFWFADGSAITYEQGMAMARELHIQGELPTGCEWTFHSYLPRTTTDETLFALHGKWLSVYLVAREVQRRHIVSVTEIGAFNPVQMALWTGEMTALMAEKVV